MEIVYNTVYTVHPSDMLNSQLFVAGDGDYAEQAEVDLIYCMLEKYEECTQGFIANLVTKGVVNPLWCMSRDSEITLLDGHHRFAVAYMHDLEVPIFIDTSDSAHEQFSKLAKQDLMTALQR